MLGADGMSSDESAVDSLETVYRMKILAWRREIGRYMDFIDQQSVADQDIYPPQGAKPTRRVRASHNCVSDHPPVCGLPLSFYDEDWVESQNGAYLELTLNVSREKFKWLELEVS